MRNESARASRRRGRRRCSRRWRRGRRRSPTGARRRATTKTRHEKTRKKTTRRMPWTSTFPRRARANLRLEPRVPTSRSERLRERTETPSRRFLLRGAFPGTRSPSARCAATTGPGPASETNTGAPVSCAGWPGGRGRSRRAPAARARGGRRRRLFARARRKKKPNPKAF